MSGNNLSPFAYLYNNGEVQIRHKCRYTADTAQRTVSVCSSPWDLHHQGFYFETHAADVSNSSWYASCYQIERVVISDWMRWPAWRCVVVAGWKNAVSSVWCQPLTRESNVAFVTQTVSPAAMGSPESNTAGGIHGLLLKLHEALCYDDSRAAALTCHDIVGDLGQECMLTSTENELGKTITPIKLSPQYLMGARCIRAKLH